MKGEGGRRPGYPPDPTRRAAVSPRPAGQPLARGAAGSSLPPSVTASRCVDRLPTQAPTSPVSWVVGRGPPTPASAAPGRLAASPGRATTAPTILLLFSFHKPGDELILYRPVYNAVCIVPCTEIIPHE
ncbi:hypothetical protein ABZP36_022664 [Zizania latifolia]